MSGINSDWYANDSDELEWDDNEDGDWSMANDDVNVSYETKNHAQNASNSASNPRSLILIRAPEIIEYKSNCLINGFVSNKNLLPSAITQLCYTYFIGDFVAECKQNVFSNKNLENNVIQCLFSALCPGANNRTFVLCLCDLICELEISQMGFNFFLFSVLLQMTKTIDFYYAVSHSTNLNEKIVNLCIGGTNTIINTRRYKVQTMISLLNQNIYYCKLLEKISNHSVWFYLEQNKRISLDIPLSKHVCHHLVPFVNYKCPENVPWKLLLQFSPKYGLLYELFCFLIMQEMRLIFADLQKAHARIKNDTLCRLQIISNKYDVFNTVITAAMKASNLIDDKLKEHLFSIITKLQSEIKFRLMNFDSYIAVTKYLMTVHSVARGANTLGWKSLQYEIDGLTLFGAEYMYLDELTAFLEGHAGLFQRSLVLCLQIIKGDKDGDVRIAQSLLRLSVAICRKVNKLIENQIIDGNTLQKFTRFYTKVTKTELIQPILQSLEADELI